MGVIGKFDDLATVGKGVFNTSVPMVSKEQNNRLPKLKGIKNENPNPKL